jgi:hypothetical protein
MDIHNTKLHDNYEMTVTFFLCACLDTTRKEACSNGTNNSLMTEMFIITAMIFVLIKQARNRQIILLRWLLFPHVFQSCAEINYSVMRGFHN